MGKVIKHIPYPSQKFAERLNLIPSIFWSIIFLSPMTTYWYQQFDPDIFYYFLAFGCLPLCLPNVFYQRIQFSSNPKFYQKWGLRYFNKVIQHGAIVNSIIRKKYPTHKVVTLNEKSIRKMMGQTFFYEKFHFAFMLFFFQTMVYTFINRQFGWLIILFVCNLLYNVYPILLQQWLRVKLRVSVERIVRQMARQETSNNPPTIGSH